MNLKVTRSGIVTAWLLVLLGAAPAFAQINFVGEWTGRYHEDQPDRVPGEEPGDFSGVPLNEAARLFGDSWDVARHSVLEHQCAPYTLPYMFFGPNQFRIWQEHNQDTQELVAIRMHLGTYQQERTIWMDGRAHPPEYAPHTFVGFSTGEFNGDMLTIYTTHIKAGFFRRSGIPNSDQTTLVEHFIRHGNVLSHVTIATDPVYLTEPLIKTNGFRLTTTVDIQPYPCQPTVEIERQPGEVPNYLPGENPYTTEFAKKHNLPVEATRGGADTALPEFAKKVGRK